MLLVSALGARRKPEPRDLSVPTSDSNAAVHGFAQQT